MQYTKKEIQKRVLQDGKPIALDKFTWNKDTNTFSTKELNLLLDFVGIDDCTFDTGSHCVFKTGHWCIFKTGSHCVFKTGHLCTFKTGHWCTFKTGHWCTFDTGSECTFDTGENCVIIRRDVYEIIELDRTKKNSIKWMRRYGIYCY